MGAYNLAYEVAPLYGNYPLVRHGKKIGEIDIANGFGQTFVTVKIIDTFLSLDEIQDIIFMLETNYHIPKNQRIAFEQV